MILTFSKYLISNHNTLRYLLFSNVFRGFSILVCRGVQVFFRVFFFFFALLFSSVTRTWRSPGACLRLTKNAEKLPVLQIKASSMKLMVHGFLFLVFLHIKTDGKNKLFFYNHINIQIRRFFSELVESKSCGKYCLIIIRIGTNTALLAFSLGM